METGNNKFGWYRCACCHILNLFIVRRKTGTREIFEHRNGEFFTYFSSHRPLATFISFWIFLPWGYNRGKAAANVRARRGFYSPLQLQIRSPA